MRTDRLFLTLFVLVLLGAGSGALAQIGGLGKKIKDVKDVAEAFSIDDKREIAMGKEAHPVLVARMGGLSKDKKLNDYVSRVGQKVARHSQRDAITYRFFVVHTDIVNAFAMAGGYVYVTKGLLRMIQDEAELAAVLGHEVAHVEARHGVKQMRQAVLAEKGADYAGDAAGSGVVGNEVARIVADLFAEMAVSGYGRKQELQADEMGLEMANSSGYDPTGAVRTFERLLELEGGSGKAGLANFLGSHPPTQKRIKQARTQIGKWSSPGTETGKSRYDSVTSKLR